MKLPNLKLNFGLPKKTNTKIESSKQPFNFDWYLIGLLAVLLIFGLIMLASSLSIQSQATYLTEFLKQLFFGIWIGGGLCYLFTILPYQNLFKVKNLFIIVTLVCLSYLFLFIIYSLVTKIPLGLNVRNFNQAFAWLPFKPVYANQAIRWINISFLPTFQPSELAKLSILIFFAGSIGKTITANPSRYSWKETKETIHWQELKTPFIILASIVGLVIFQPDLGNALLMLGLIIGAMWITRVDIKILGGVLLVAIVFSSLLIANYTYRLNRINSFLDFVNNSSTACINDTTGNNFQVCKVRSALSAGGLWGKGYGNSQTKSVIPEVSSDAILGVVGEELGFVGVAFLLLLYLLLFNHSLKIADQTIDIQGKFLASGIGFWLFLQVILNVAGITGLLPLKGSPLPFVSEGGTALVLNLLAMGILLNISSQRPTILTNNPTTSTFRKTTPTYD